MIVLAFGVKAPGEQVSKFSYYLCVEQVRTTRRAISCGDRTGSVVKISFPLAYHSSINLIAGHYRQAAHSNQFHIMGERDRGKKQFVRTAMQRIFLDKIFI